MWEEHCYHYKSDFSQRKIKKFTNHKSARGDREARLNRNIFITAQEAHNLDPTYVVRAAIHAKMLGGMNSDRNSSFGRCFTYSDREVPQDIIQNISGLLSPFNLTLTPEHTNN